MNNERRLGSSDITTPPLILGGNVFGWTADQSTSFAILDAFVAGGGRMIDTADIYSTWVEGNSGGESEAIIGAWLTLRGRRDDVVIATKVGAEMGGSRGLAPARVEEHIEASLRRLRTDYIDVYFAHRDDQDTPIEVVLETFDHLVRAGKVRAIGASNFTAVRLRESLDVGAQNNLAAYSILQPEYNLLERSKFEGALQELCVERNVASVPYYALASGFLTGKYRQSDDLQGRARGKSVERYLNDFGFGVLRAIDAVAVEASATAAQVALAWLSAQPSVAAPIASATSVEQVEEIVGAMRLKLSAEQLAALDHASSSSADLNA